MGGVISVHRDLADGGADGPDTQSVVTELPVDLFRLGKRNVRNVHPVHAPDFKALKLIAKHGGDLSVDHRAGFIGKCKNVQLFH